MQTHIYFELHIYSVLAIQFLNSNQTGTKLHRALIIFVNKKWKFRQLHKWLILAIVAVWKTSQNINSMCHTETKNLWRGIWLPCAIFNNSRQQQFSQSFKSYSVFFNFSLILLILPFSSLYTPQQFLYFHPNFPHSFRPLSSINFLTFSLFLFCDNFPFFVPIYKTIIYTKYVNVLLQRYFSVSNPNKIKNSLFRNTVIVFFPSLLPLRKFYFIPVYFLLLNSRFPYNFLKYLHMHLSAIESVYSTSLSNTLSVCPLPNQNTTRHQDNVKEYLLT